MIQTINPATGKVEKTFEPHTAEEIEKKLQQAADTFKMWRKTLINERTTLIQKLADHLQEEKETYAKLATLEMGRPYKESLNEIIKSIALCNFYSKNGEKFLAEENIETEASKSYVQFDPLGVILGVMPWNYPFTQAFRPMIPAIIAGNTFVLKHASNVPQCSQAIENMFEICGFPKGVMTNLLVEGKNIEAIIADDRITAVTVTGSEKTGASVASIAGKHLKKSVLELGGSDAFIVLSDADIEHTVQQAVKARTTNAGQSCNSPKRFIVHEKIAQEFTDLFVQEVKKLTIGDPLDPKTDIGPITRSDLRDLLDKQVHDTVKKGARLLHGGKKLDREGFFYEVTVVDNVKKGMPLFDEEVFGPVAAITTVKNEEEAIGVANDTHLGLSASVWTKNPDKVHYFTHDLHVGLVFINQAVRSDVRLPYGGVKKSGYGRELGRFGIQEFTNIKSVVIK
ncbi:MAG TPA: NAD-dependent succinate-semialdehyde dehydrogenase [Candidatus Saccharimonadales bacterium]|nr:NAD-dependent succinate-semialdehyde dehydrogenase [Candidatus Saccharimonadales bacterium]